MRPVVQQLDKIANFLQAFCEHILLASVEMPFSNTQKVLKFCASDYIVRCSLNMTLYHLFIYSFSSYLFWSDTGASAAIERCALDGTNRTVLVQEDITWPSGVTLDTAAQLVYWIDGSFDTISSMDYNGNNRKTIFDDSRWYKLTFLSQFDGFDLDISGDFIYFRDLWKISITKINKNTGVRVKTISVPTSTFIEGLRVIDSSKQPSGK